MPELAAMARTMLTPTGVRDITPEDRAIIFRTDDAERLVALVKQLTPHIRSSRSRSHLDALLFVLVSSGAFIALLVTRAHMVFTVLAGAVAIGSYVVNHRASKAERARIARFRAWIEAIGARVDELST